MYKLKQILLMSVLLCSTFFAMNVLPVSATELQEASPAENIQETTQETTETPADDPSDIASSYSPCVHIQVAYSDDIAPQQNDNFNITYKNQNSTETASITFDASTLNGNVGKLDLPAGEYEITNIEYTGSNNSIYKQGYAISKTFSVSETPDNYSEFLLAIGTTAGNSLIDQTSPDVVAVQNGYAVNRLEEAEAAEVEDTTETISEDSSQISDTTTEEKQNTTEEIVQKSNVNRGSLLGRFIPIAIFAIIGISIMLYLRKINKI